MIVAQWTKRVFSMELRKMITYRADFWVNFIGQTLISIVISYYLWKAIFDYNNVTELNGHTLSKILLYYLLAPLIFRIQQGDGIGGISREIYEGGLNKYLLYPINFFKYKITTYLAASSFYLFQLFVLLGIYCFFFYDPQVYTFSLANTLMFIITVLLGSVTFFFFNALSELVAFWADYIWSLGVLGQFLARFLGGALVPLAFFPDWTQTLLYYTPFPYLIDVPLQIMFNQVGLSDFCVNLLVLGSWTFFFYVLSQLLWRKGQYSYTGIGI